MSRASKLVLVPTIQAYPEYASWWKTRGLEWRMPGPPNIGIFMALGKELVSGACVYVMDGPYCMLEHFSVSPKFVRAKGTYKAKGSRKVERFSVWSVSAERTIREFQRIAIALSKWPILHTEVKSLGRVCAENGFQCTGARLFVAPMVTG